MVRRYVFIQRYGGECISGAAGGLLLALSFPPFPTRFLAAVALVPLFRYFLVTAGAKIDRPLRRALVLGYTFGVAFFLTLLYWVSNLIPASSARMPWLMIPATGLLVLYLSCYTALFAVSQQILVRRFGARGLAAGPALWSLLEFARSRGELGFSWGILSNALVTHPIAVQGVSVYGPFGLSFVVALVGLLLSIATVGPSWRRRACALAAALAVVGGHLAWGAREIARFDREMEGVPASAVVAVVQPNLDLGLKWVPSERDTIFQEIERFTARAAAAGANLVIFPETAAPISIAHNLSYVRWLKRMARDNRIDLFTGLIDYTLAGEEWYPHNAAALFSGAGEIAGLYRKINLLPFGERMPFSQYIPQLRKLDFGQANFLPGMVPTIFHSSAGAFGALICFESTFADYTRRYVRGGADFLVNITNDGWFGSRVGPLQHAEAAILRAVENRVPLLRAANTGISMAVDPVGRVTNRIGIDREGFFTAPLRPRGDLTVFCRHGHAVFFIMVLACSIATAVLGLTARRA